MAEERLKQEMKPASQSNDNIGLQVANTNKSPFEIHLDSVLRKTVEFAPEATKSRLLNWLLKVSHTDLPVSALRDDRALVWHTAERPGSETDDWLIIASLSGHTPEEFASAATPLPLLAAEVAHFRRNHRGADLGLARRFKKPDGTLPDSVQSLYTLYQERAYADVEATLFIAQASGSTRVARVMADLQAIGSFANAHHVVHHMAISYAVATAFDTSELIDIANHEAASRLALQVNHPAHLLKLSPEDIAQLAAAIVEKNLLEPSEFGEKARLLAEARSDVNRFAPSIRFRVAVTENDMPPAKSWVRRIGLAYSRMFESWVTDLPELGLPARGQRVISA